MKLLFLVGAPEFRCPRMADSELMKSEHIHNTNMSQGAAEEIGSLIDTSSDKETAIASSFNTQFGWPRISFGNEEFSRGYEVVDAVLLS